jgi:hypothetical protein
VMRHEVVECMRIERKVRDDKVREMKELFWRKTGRKG